MHIKLNNNYSLTTEPHLKGVRLIVLAGAEECVCRKESFKNLNAFIGLNEGRLFKGRLQLCKHQSNITVEVKGTCLGTISAAQLQQLMQ